MRDLATELEEAQRELMNLRFRVATMQLANVTQVKRGAEAHREDQHHHDGKGAGESHQMSYERRKVRTGRVVSDKMDRTNRGPGRNGEPRTRLYKKPVPTHVQVQGPRP